MKTIEKQDGKLDLRELPWVKVKTRLTILASALFMGETEDNNMEIILGDELRPEAIHNHLAPWNDQGMTVTVKSRAKLITVNLSRSDKK